MNIKSGNIQKFSTYSQFESLKEFNNHIEMWMIDVKADFTKSELIGFKRLVRFAAKIPGVCNAKIGTMLKAIHEEYENYGISRSTFKRMIKKAISLGIITTYDTARKNGSQTSNLYVFNRYPVSTTKEPPNERKMSHPKEANNLSEASKSHTNKRKKSAECQQQFEITYSVTKNANELDASFTSDAIPEAFTQTVKGFFNKAKVIEDYWRMVKIAAYRNLREDDPACCLHYAIHAFKQMIGKWKSKKVKKPIAYFYGVLNRKFEKLYFEELYDMGFRPGNEEDDFWEVDTIYSKNPSSCYSA